jgi:hypothetical protein
LQRFARFPYVKDSSASAARSGFYLAAARDEVLGEIAVDAHRAKFVAD